MVAHMKSFILMCSTLLLSSCVSGIWTGANLFYDRHTVYHSVSDLELNSRAHHALFHDHLFKGEDCHLEVAIFNGDILLAGHVETPQSREEAYKRITAIPGFRRLFKEVSVQAFPPNGLKDSWITTKICSQIIADSDINPKSFKVITADQVVYLMGDVIPEQAKWVTSIARSTSGVKKVVKLFKYYHLSNQETL